MTGNVAQVFVDDRGWDETLAAVRASLRAGGWLVFETRDPGSQAWRHRTHEHTYHHAGIAGSLERAGFRLEEVRDAPDRPGLEMVFLAVRAER